MALNIHELKKIKQQKRDNNVDAYGENHLTLHGIIKSSYDAIKGDVNENEEGENYNSMAGLKALQERRKRGAANPQIIQREPSIEPITSGNYQNISRSFLNDQSMRVGTDSSLINNTMTGLIKLNSSVRKETDFAVITEDDRLL